MDPSSALPEDQSSATTALGERLRARLRGEVRFDRLARTIYATDASIYEIVPIGVAMPRDVDDVVTAVNECRRARVSIIARGAGTGLTGGAVGPGLQLDLSKHMNRIGRVDSNAGTVEVEPGVVLDELNAQLAQHGLWFAPDVATSSRATIGGMIANNSCGAHSLIYGRTVDHVIELTVVLAGGEVVTFGRNRGSESGESREAGEAGDERQRASAIERELARIRDGCHEEIERRFPKVARNNGGYGLDRLGSPATPADAVKILCGSEGTLGVVVRAELALTPVPRHRGLVLLHFRSHLDALAATPAALAHRPAAVELVDRMIIEASRARSAPGSRSVLLTGDPAAVLAVEFFGDSDDNVSSQVDCLLADGEATARTYATSTVPDTRRAEFWDLRASGLGLLMSKPGDEQPYAFVEDSVVDPARLREYIERVGEILDAEGVHAGYYAHASVGCIHVKPVLNLKDGAGVEKMGRIAEAVADLAIEFGGAVTGEHGDGIVRSCWLEKMYGPRILAAFKEVKDLFDPTGLMNPHKIVDPWPMTENLRYGPSFGTHNVKTYLDFSAHGGMAQLAGMCSGVGQCRKRLVGTMCPSYMATGDEVHTTRARANALRVALSNRGLLDGLGDPQLAEVMDLCLSCKACKSECPTGVDMARLKSEYLARQTLITGASRRARFIVDLPARLAVASKLPRLSNVVASSTLTRRLLESRYGLDRRLPPPRLASQPFRAWFRGHRRRTAGRKAPYGTVVYFVDTWTNHFTPKVGVAAVRLLERAGFEVLCPGTVCCGRPAISQGLLGEAKQLAEFNVRRLTYLAAKGVPIIGTEPSCILTLVDEYPQLVRTPAARRVAAQAVTIETFLRRLLDERPDAIEFAGSPQPLIYHAHCHQKAIVGTDDADALLARVFGESASRIDSGCCGMAGSFGHEKEHYEIARTIGEQRLFPAVRNRGDAGVAISGFSCRQHIEHHTGAHPRHLVEYLAGQLA